VTRLQTQLQGTINEADTFLKQTLRSVPQSSPLYAKISSIAQKVAYVAGASLVVYAGYNFLPGIMSSMASWFQTSDSNSNGMSPNPGFQEAAVRLTGQPLPKTGPSIPWSTSFVSPATQTFVATPFAPPLGRVVRSSTQQQKIEGPPQRQQLSALDASSLNLLYSATQGKVPPQFGKEKSD
jgi:hypothetical protein